MICKIKLGDFITQRHNELRDLEAEFLSMVCSDVEIEPEDISGEHLNRGSNKAQDAKLDIHARGFWERHQSAFFRGTQREYSLKPLKHSIVKRILVFKR